MLTQRQIDPQAGLPRLRSALATAAVPVRDAAWAVEERLVWVGGDVLRRVLDAVRWSLERLAWAAEQQLLWPLQERAGGWRLPLRAVGAAALALVIAVAATVLLLASGGGGKIGVRSVAVKVAPPQAPPAPRAPATPKAQTLHGASPVFESALPKTAPPSPPAVSTAEASRGGGVASQARGGKTATQGGSSSPATPAVPGEVAGPAAIAVARRFSDAFVLYETGQTDSAVRTGLRATTTRQLAAQLLHRPPRLPANVEVPQARVLNVVPGPKLGRDCTVSVSLLRVGISSELRLSLHSAKRGGWLVREVLG